MARLLPDDQPPNQKEQTMQQTTHHIDSWIGQTLIDRDGEKIGEIKDVYLNAETERPEWLAVGTGLFGRRVSFVPLAGAEVTEEGVRVPYDDETVKGSPNAEPDDELGEEHGDSLYEHYGLVYGARREAPAAEQPVGHDVSGPTTDSAMTRSEEELRVGKAAVESGRVRLRKYVVTEHVETVVPVQREEVRIEREPITDANVDQAMDGPAISEEEHEVVLYEEEPVVEKRVVPKERVRMEKAVVTEERAVNDELRKEQIEADGAERAERR